MGHDGTWDMIGPDLTGVCLARFTFSSSFIFRHTRKRTRGVGFGLGWVGLLVHHNFYFFWNACMVVYGFAWFDRVGFLWEKM